MPLKSLKLRPVKDGIQIIYVKGKEPVALKENMFRRWGYTQGPIYRGDILDAEVLYGNPESPFR